MTVELMNLSHGEIVSLPYANGMDVLEILAELFNVALNDLAWSFDDIVVTEGVA